MEEESEKSKKDDISPKAPGSDAPEQAEVKTVTIPEMEYQKLIKDVAEYKDRTLRLLAEFENARKRMERDRLEFLKYANEGLIIEFLEVIDNLERSVEAAKAKHEDYEAFLHGVELVMGQINKMLAQNGVKPIEAKGKKFDPHAQEVLYQETNNEVEEGTVLEELQKGYMLGDRVIRTAKVKLAQKENK